MLFSKKSPPVHSLSTAPVVKELSQGVDDATVQKITEMCHLAAQGDLEARIIGIFSRLIARDGKPRYRAFLPRMWRHLMASLADPGLAGVRRWIETRIPESVRT